MLSTLAARSRRPALFLIFALACLPIAAVDVASGEMPSPWAMYLLPVGLAGWLCGRAFAMWLAAYTVLLIVAAAVLNGHPFTSWAYFSLAAVNRAASLFGVGWLASVAGRVSQLESLLRSMQEDH